MTPELIQAYGLAIMAVLGAGCTLVLIPVAARLLPIVITSLAPMVRDGIKGKKDQQAFDAVSRAAARATSVAAGVYEDALVLAAAPGSDGGTEITPKESGEAWASYVATAWKNVDRQEMTAQVESAYGSRAAAEAAFIAIARKALTGQVQG